MDDFREKLMADVLGEDSDPAAREALLGHTLRLARRKRRLGKLRRAVPAVVAIAVLFFITARFFRPGPLAPRLDAPSLSPSYISVRSLPLPPGALVTTKPLDATSVVRTSFSVATVTTVPCVSSRCDLTDEELLKFTDGLPVVLIRQNNHAAELVFVNAADREALMRN
jgi:hypothetical protein